MARQNSNISARVLDIEVFDTLNRGIKRYAKKCREIFFYPRKVIDDVNDNLNDAKLTLEVELSKASENERMHIGLSKWQKINVYMMKRGIRTRLTIVQNKEPMTLLYARKRS